jgi:acyl-CoA synthetase (AMP-forming)/AMP-acid ligase II
MLNADNWEHILSHGFELQSSATTGPAKRIFQPPEKLAAANRVAVDAQGLTPLSRVLTLCRMSHAGGALAQTLPAWSIGAHVEIRPFNAYSFWQDIQGFTHTHLTPAHCAMLMNTHGFASSDFDGLFVACGSDRVSFDIIEAFVAHNAVFMCNWGMTEIGPICINTVFNEPGQVRDYKRAAIEGGTLMGDCYFCDYKILAGELVVRGDTCVYPGWYNSGDRVIMNDKGALYFMGRRESLSVTE